MTTPYSRLPDRVAAARQFLVSVRDREDAELPRYGEVAQVIGGVAQGVAPVLNSVLNSVARDCAEAGDPDLSALVVLAGSRLPGRLNGTVVDPNDRRVLVAWQVELECIRAHDWA
jgi:hypothetical protein